MIINHKIVDKKILAKFYLFNHIFLFYIPIHDAAVVKVRKTAIKIQIIPLKDWYVHIGSRLPYLDSTKYVNAYAVISKAPPRANVTCLLIGKIGARSSRILYVIADVNLK